MFRFFGGIWVMSTSLAPLLSSPLILMIRPEVGCSIPISIRRIVVFPHPEGPSRERNSPRITSKEMSSRTVLFLNFLLMCSARMIASAILSS